MKTPTGRPQLQLVTPGYTPTPAPATPGPAGQHAADAQADLFALLAATPDPAIRAALTTGYFLGLRAETAHSRRSRMTPQTTTSPAPCTGGDADPADTTALPEAFADCDVDHDETGHALHQTATAWTPGGVGTYLQTDTRLGATYAITTGGDPLLLDFDEFGALLTRMLRDYLRLADVLAAACPGRPGTLHTRPAPDPASAA